MTDDPAAQADEVLEAYQRAAEAGGRAPSVHNTQPWRWLATRFGLELRADRSRQLHAADPDGHVSNANLSEDAPSSSPRSCC